ncbi:HAD-IIA family hydrolase [Corynebacterium halotolerans]|uniref:GCN5-related N-acetyltransferase-like domain-containing protein n=1 Tax=Corynebacterium halotolerans YIM 70093 = DSM 44683 TaxID=1121362 RepID=M1NSD2_9CORY|nr:HAD-IIA family hydrolase [Corynebacterium halotolerans]AGF72382.1 hypothetical protein A605_06900 [Corynebacterium halotolerans YIM 70093 = DSM 44683]
MSLLTHHDALLLDLDGTVWEGGRAIPGAVEAITGAGLPGIYVTNNAYRAPGDVAEKLGTIGLSVGEDQVLTSAQAAIELASEHLTPGDPVLVVGSDSFRGLATQAGYVVVESADEQPRVVFQGHNPATGWAQLSEAALAIRAGAIHVASNLDTTLPSERGLLVGNGSMVAAVVSATGEPPVAAGKPGPALFRSAAARLGASRPLVVGDRIDTDIEGGNAAGMPTFQVFTGVSGHFDVLRAPREQRPTYLADSLAELNHDPRELRPGAQGGFTARLDSSDLLLDGGGPEATPIQALRTAAEVAWASEYRVKRIRPVGEHAKTAVGAWW